MNRILSTLLLLLLPILASATSIFDLLQQEDDRKATEMTLTVPMDSILAKVATEQEAGLSFTDNKGRMHDWNLSVSIRGKFRRNRCEYAPLKLNFSKKDLEAIGLEKFDKYKLVTPCFADPSAEDLILKEYLAYKAYNLLTPYSFRVQLLKITYRDANGVYPDRVATAFIIEANKEMATRLSGEEMENALGQPAEAYDSRAEATHALFQYMIGNGDFSLPLARNLKVIKMADGRLIPVGYDFDFTGWVGAPYASATSEVGQTSIYDRVYLGYVQPDEVMRELAADFCEQRKAILSLINRSDLSYVDQEQLWRFASRFFGQLNRMAKSDEALLYDQLRGDTAQFIPPGAEAGSFLTTGK